MNVQISERSDEITSESERTTAVRAARVTINEVAAHAKVSRQTVSNTLNFPERVKPSTLERVRASIDQLGYRPSAPSQQLRQQRARAIGFELNAIGATRGDVTHPFLVALSMAAPRRGLHLVPFASDDSRPTVDGYVDTVCRHLVDGFVLVDTHEGDPRPSWLDERSIPWVAFGRIWNNSEATTWVDVDGHAGTEAAVDHLVTQGYDRIGYLGWPAGSPVGDDRRNGWSDATERHGITTTPQASCEQGIAEATAAAIPLLDEVGRGGAVVCASDMLALGVLHAALRRGWDPGRDLGIVGFDGSNAARMSGITTVVQPLQQIADACVELLHGLVDGASPPQSGLLVRPQLEASTSTDPTSKGIS